MIATPFRKSSPCQPILRFLFITASALVPSLSAHAGPNIPPPPGNPVISAGQVPRLCTESDHPYNSYGATYGYFYSKSLKRWESAPYCYARWGYLGASAPQVISAGDIVTVSAIHDDARVTPWIAVQGGMAWQYPGTLISGCGATDLTCTVKIGSAASPPKEWQWYEFHVSGPGRYFILPPSYAPRCQPDNPCIDTATNAWSYVGVQPNTCSSLAQLSGSGGLPHVATCKKTISGTVLRTLCPPPKQGNNTLKPDPSQCQEVGVSGATVQIYRGSNLVVTKRTNKQGVYSASVRKNGAYKVKVSKNKARFSPAVKKANVNGVSVSGVGFRQKGAASSTLRMRNRIFTLSDHVVENGAELRMCNQDSFDHQPYSEAPFEPCELVKPGKCVKWKLLNPTGSILVRMVWDCVHPGEGAAVYVLP